MTSNDAITPERALELQRVVSGPVLLRADEGIPSETTSFNIAVTHDPDIVVGVTSESDVVEAVRFAAAEGIPVRVQATGHGVVRPVTEGMLIVTTRMRDVHVDAATRLATIGAGATWAAVIDAGAEHGLGPVIGSSPGVGAVGYTLGGGIGPLVRSHGVTADWVRSFRVVTADGTVLTADRDRHPELFWALCGGKGGLGVVTELTLELAELRTIYAGGLFFEGAEPIERALRAWHRWLPSAPDDVTTSVAFLRMPPLEMIPEPLRGRTLLHLRVAYPGPAEEGERIIAPLRAAAEVYLDTVGEIPYSAVGSIHNDPEQGSAAWVYGAMLTGLDDEAVDAVLTHVGPAAPSPFLIAELRHLAHSPDGGAQRALPKHTATAVGGLEAAFLLTLISLNPETFAEAAPTTAAALSAAITGSLAQVTNVNFSGDTDDAATFERSWSPEVHERLRLARASYDPTGLFAFGPAR